ncbi:hypothetical protein [uncultured Streptomyces sp.]|uniref:hypothetical protein n=1 Tax=uncultured Streptomyces sp. TaxID=174707 RepID=UPI0026102828|nr:hypothetical protein [uncultured Streptomyces sp.]
MSGTGFFQSYHWGWGRPDATTLLCDLEADGMRLAPPSGGAEATRAMDGTGPSPGAADHRERFLALAGSQELDSLDVRLRVGGAWDVPLRIRRAGGGAVAVEIGLSGLPYGPCERVVRAVRHTVGRASMLCLGFVLDRGGVTAGTDWDRVVVDGTERIGGWPDVLAVRDRIACTHAQLAGRPSEDRSPWRVFGGEIVTV